MKRAALSIVVFAVLRTSTFAAITRTYDNNTNAWLMYFGDHKFSKDFGVHLEAQLRRTSFVTDPQQLLLRTGLNYHVSPNMFFTVGYCFVETHPYGQFPAKSSFPENRFWEQMQIRNQVGRMEYVSRFCLEQRFQQLPTVDSADNRYEPGEPIYTNRFRLLNRFSIPLNGNSISSTSFYLSIYDELFVNFGKNVGYNIFDQNRAYIAIGKSIPKVGRVELGYMLQNIFRSDGIKVESNHTLQIGLSSTISFKKT